TEVSGYVSDAYFEEGEEVDPGIRNYVESKLSPEIPDGYLSFYPMSKRRHPEDNWYMLPIEERADLMAEHGETGRDFAGRIQQLITSALGFDDWEWGVTLFSDDPAAIKDVVYEMRFDEASARFAEFGPFYVARQFPPADLPAYMAGEAVPAGEEGTDRTAATATADDGESAAGGPPDAVTHDDGDEKSPVYGGQPRGEDVHARVVYSTAGGEELATAVDELSESFDHYDTHRGTDVYENEAAEGAPAAVVSLWDTAKAADIAAGFLADLPEATASADGTPPAAEADGGEASRAGDTADDGDAAEGGWGTMGMFYTVKPEHRAEFVERFAEVGDLLAETEGHRGTDLLVNRADENDMFIASRWDAKEDAQAFFRSDAFTETVSWGRGVLADTPRHVFFE
ncbi:MAG: heme-binding protein, partial [Halobacteriaceae archaeon]